jgi:hypothetical protein
MRTLISLEQTIGSVLATHMSFDLILGDHNLEQAATEHLGLVVAPTIGPSPRTVDAAPACDLTAIRRVQEVLAVSGVDHLVLISSTAVYPGHLGADENSPIDRAHLTPYARHRYDLERWAAARFNTTIVRLPQFFGGGWRGEIERPRSAIAPAPSVQLYDLERIGMDIMTALRAGLPSVNLVPPPVKTAQLHGWSPPPAFASDVRTTHAAAFGRQGAYIMTQEEELARIAAQ